MIDEEKRNDASGFSSLRFMAGVSGIGMEREELTCTSGTLYHWCTFTGRLGTVVSISSYKQALEIHDCN